RRDGARVDAGPAVVARRHGARRLRAITLGRAWTRRALGGRALADRLARLAVAPAPRGALRRPRLARRAPGHAAPGPLAPALAAAAVACLAVRSVSTRIAALPVKPLAWGGLALVVSASVATCGAWGLALLCVAGLVGVVPARLGVRRSLCMGAILVPALVRAWGVA